AEAGSWLWPSFRGRFEPIEWTLCALRGVKPCFRFTRTGLSHVQARTGTVVALREACPANNGCPRITRCPVSSLCFRLGSARPADQRPRRHRKPETGLDLAKP